MKIGAVDRDVDSESMIFGDFIHFARSAKAKFTKKKDKGDKVAEPRVAAASPINLGHLQQMARASLGAGPVPSAGTIVKKTLREDKDSRENLRRRELHYLCRKLSRPLRE